MLIAALFRTFASLRHGFILRFLVISFVLSLVLYAVLAFGLWMVLHEISFSSIHHINVLVDWLGSAAALVLAYFLLPMLFPAFTGVFLEDIVLKLEEKEYKIPEKSGNQSLTRMLYHTIAFSVVYLVWNIIAFPAYLIPLLGPLFYYMINGYFFGREYADMVLLRHMSSDQLSAIRKEHRRVLVVAGVLLMVMFTVPFVNLMGPVIASVFMTHFCHLKGWAKG